MPPGLKPPATVHCEALAPVAEQAIVEPLLFLEMTTSYPVTPLAVDGVQLKVTVAFAAMLPVGDCATGAEAAVGHCAKPGAAEKRARTATTANVRRVIGTPCLFGMDARSADPVYTMLSAVLVSSSAENHNDLGISDGAAGAQFTVRQQRRSRFRPGVDAFGRPELGRGRFDPVVVDGDGASMRFADGAQHEAAAHRARHAQPPRLGLRRFPLRSAFELLLDRADDRRAAARLDAPHARARS